MNNNNSNNSNNYYNNKNFQYRKKINPISGIILAENDFHKYIWTNINGDYLITTFYNPIENKYYTKKILNNIFYKN